MDEIKVKKIIFVSRLSLKHGKSKRQGKLSRDYEGNRERDND